VTDLKDIMSQLGDDVVNALVKRFFPQQRGRGRPKKASMTDSIDKGVIAAKIILPALGCLVLTRKGIIDNEDLSMVMTYVADKVKELPVTSLYPKSPNWVVREALREIGHPQVENASVTWEEVVAEAQFLFLLYQQARQPQQVRVASQPQAQPGGIDWARAFKGFGVSSVFPDGVPGAGPGGAKKSGQETSGEK
jgi:hypothetical protein